MKVISQILGTLSSGARWFRFFRAYRERKYDIRTSFHQARSRQREMSRGLK